MSVIHPMCGIGSAKNDIESKIVELKRLQRNHDLLLEYHLADPRNVRKELKYIWNYQKILTLWNSLPKKVQKKYENEWG